MRKSHLKNHSKNQDIDDYLFKLSKRTKFKDIDLSIEDLQNSNTSSDQDDEKIIYSGWLKILKSNEVNAEQLQFLVNTKYHHHQQLEVKDENLLSDNKSKFYMEYIPDQDNNLSKKQEAIYPQNKQQQIIANLGHGQRFHKQNWEEQYKNKYLDQKHQINSQKQCNIPDENSFYFVLTQKYLRVFYSDLDAQENSKLAILNEIDIQFLQSVQNLENSFGLCFKINKPVSGQMWDICANNLAEKITWMTKLRYLIEQFSIYQDHL